METLEEEFKTIRKFDNYKINIHGVIINRHGKVVKTHKSNVLQEFLGNRVRLYNSKGKRVNCLVKRLVADTFIGDVDGKNVILVDTDKGISEGNIVILNKTRNPK
jgi:hypothetical protein